ncbi:hypothetical protein VB715_03225 [Crocosphaera sp. UHCC 0190]|uniref:hypothetical protein n=1 Tax=Crocosphaera sp. UHCC 0190 TaxID=3110246 RepID=UPI002B1FEC48|nr:hypothetical protein [Crocosphaera sp. UHCC 0190]MEA5508766.1 hypothetical protein [Crocosphaera sp. UHCC 0190]
MYKEKQMHVNIHGLSHDQNQIVATNGNLRHRKENPVMMILLVVLGSFVLGSLPIIYGFNLASSLTQAPTVPHEGTLWSPAGK